MMSLVMSLMLSFIGNVISDVIGNVIRPILIPIITSNASKLLVLVNISTQNTNLTCR